MASEAGVKRRRKRTPSKTWVIEVGDVVAVRGTKVEAEVHCIHGRLVWLHWFDEYTEEEKEAVVHMDLLEALPSGVNP